MKKGKENINLEFSLKTFWKCSNTYSKKGDESLKIEKLLS
jgi:hypothetical protein